MALTVVSAAVGFCWRHAMTASLKAAASAASSDSSRANRGTVRLGAFAVVTSAAAGFCCRHAATASLKLAACAASSYSPSNNEPPEVPKPITVVLLLRSTSSRSLAGIDFFRIPPPPPDDVLDPEERPFKASLCSPATTTTFLEELVAAGSCAAASSWCFSIHLRSFIRCPIAMPSSCMWSSFISRITSFESNPFSSNASAYFVRPSRASTSPTSAKSLFCFCNAAARLLLATDGVVDDVAAPLSGAAADPALGL
mmetsp:Transcript_22843/g.57759  ORF Transcript_22843/g.57759 Transcript_22843/m.57759 type:complete len:255 (+) Transcript_22843:1523-2287(+)